MMGSRGKLSASEWDAFSRRSRKLLRWRPGEIKKLKREFSSRVRAEGKREAERQLEP